MVKVGWVRISSTDPPVQLEVRLADQRPNVTSGYGGWNEVARPKRRPLAIWGGSPGLRLDLPVLFDGFQAGRSVEKQLAQLEKIATAGAAGDGAPSRVRIQAPGAGVPHQGATWVIDTLTWGDGLMDASGNRTRQQVTLGLLEYIADTRVADQSASTRQRAKASAGKTQAGASAKTVMIATRRNLSIIAGALHPGTLSAGQALAEDEPPGEDLLSIAARELGDARRWPEIAKLNGIRDPRAVKRGQVLRLP